MNSSCRNLDKSLEISNISPKIKSKIKHKNSYRNNSFSNSRALESKNDIKKSPVIGKHRHRRAIRRPLLSKNLYGKQKDKFNVNTTNKFHVSDSDSDDEKLESTEKDNKDIKSLKDIKNIINDKPSTSNQSYFHNDFLNNDGNELKINIIRKQPEWNNSLDIKITEFEDISVCNSQEIKHVSEDSPDILDVFSQRIEEKNTPIVSITTPINHL